jgi:hypothetical protein
MNTRTDEDKDYVIKIIQYLQFRHGIFFFITCKDFDALYNWWHKRIPLHIIRESITSVVERWRGKNKKIHSFSNFRYDVRKNFKNFLQLQVGSATGNQDIYTAKEEKGEFQEIEHFFNHYPQDLNELREEFETIFRQLKNQESVKLKDVYQKLTDLFKDNNELNLKTSIFLKNLSPELRKPEIEQKYRLNYLLNKFNIPDFDIL